jgi:predicted DNA-binding transcriptional regulator AlpA
MSVQSARPLVRLTAVLSRLGISRSTLYRLTYFPPPVRFGPRSPRWFEDDVDRYIEAHRDER